MKIAIVIFGVLGAFLSGSLGYSWLSDIGEITDFQRTIIGISGQSGEIRDLASAGAALLIGFFAGIAGAIASLMNKFAFGSLLMLGAGILPAFFVPEALFFTCFLIVGGVLAFFLHRKIKSEQHLNRLAELVADKIERNDADQSSEPKSTASK